jgi:hypothetical protein
MLWKYKKCYSESNEDTLNPNICVKLVSLTSQDQLTEIEYSYILCGETERVSDIFIEYVTLNICIIENSLLISNPSVQIINTNCD